MELVGTFPPLFVRLGSVFWLLGELIALLLGMVWQVSRGETNASMQMIKKAQDFIASIDKSMYRIREELWRGSCGKNNLP